MKLLNPKEVYNNEEVEIGGSLYWNKEKGNCYQGKNNTYVACDFTSSGISDEAKIKLAKVRWNTGTVGPNSAYKASLMYLAERGSYNGKDQCISNGGGDGCNDEIERTTTWDGYIGLIYPSDYGYAVESSERIKCLEKDMWHWDTTSCNYSSWLGEGDSWTITPKPYNTSASSAFSLYNEGSLNSRECSYIYTILPTAYLKSNVKIVENPHPEKDREYGSKLNPFVAI